MRRRGFLGRFFGGVLVAAGVVKAAPKVTTWLINTDYCKYTGPNAGRFDKILFKGVELVPDVIPAKYALVQMHSTPKGHDLHMMDLITDAQARTHKTMVDVLDKGFFRNA